MAMDVRWRPREGKFLLCFLCTVFIAVLGQQSSMSTNPVSSLPSSAAISDSSSPPSTLTPAPVSSLSATSESSSLALPAPSECVCDLSVGRCDLRCCCDPECSAADRAVFSSCADIGGTTTSQSCVSSHLVVDSNNAYRTVRDESTNLFCVSVDNNPSRLSYVVPERVTDAATFRLLVSRYGSGQETVATTPSPLTWQRSYYRSGEAVLVISPPNVQGWLAVPSSFGGSVQCTDYNPVQYLVSSRSKCRRPLSSVQAMCTNVSVLSASVYISNFRIARSPLLLETINSELATVATVTSDTAGSGAGVPTGSGGNESVPLYDSDQLVSISVRRVQCRMVNGAVADCPAPVSSGSVPEPSFNASAGTCDFVLEQASFLVTHNNTGGIVTVTVDLVLRSVASGLSDTEQEFTYAFQEQNEASLFTRSGNPGYLRGNPVLAGRLITSSTVTVRVFNESSNETVIISNSYIELSPRPQDWLTSSGYPASTPTDPRSSRDCLSAPMVPVSVRFGEDRRSGCLMHYDVDNLTQSCSVLQSVSRSILPVPTGITHVGEFGNSLPNDTSSWVEILTSNSVTSPSASVVGVQCPNVRVGLSLEVLYAKTGRLAEPQLRIVGVQYSFVHANVYYQCYNSQCVSGRSPTQSVELVSSTTFIDVSSQLRPELQEVPVTGGQLPYDFFYPFVRSNSVSYHLPSLATITISCLLSFLIILLLN